MSKQHSLHHKKGTISKDQATRPTWGERVDKWIRSRSLVVILVFIAFFGSTILTIVKNSGDIWQGYTATFRWQEVEYSKLSGLRGGMAIGKVQEILGQPTFVRKTEIY